MELQDYFRIIRKRWRIITTMVILGVAGAAAFTHFTPRSYQATTKLFVSTGSGDSSATDLANGSAFAQKQMKTYADVMTSDVVLGPVSRQLHLDGTDGLKKAVTVLVPADTVLLQVQTTHHDPAFAVRVSNAVARQFAKTVQNLQPGAAVKASVVQSAATPTAPVSPQPVKNLGLGLVLGLLAGLGLAVLRDVMDTTVKDEQDVTRLTDRAVIGTIAVDPAAAKRPLLLRDDLKGPRAEAFRSLRTNLQFLDASNRPRTIMITSSLPDEGKTSTAGNLAITLGASGARVAVVEADLRRPRLVQYMGLEGSVGLTNVLIGQVELADVLQPFTGNVTVLGAGPIPPNPSELLGSPQMQAVIAQLAASFDHVIVDVPPLLPVTDAAVVSRLVDGTILVAASGQVRRDALAKSVERLRAVDANLLGVVLTHAPAKGPTSYAYKAQTRGKKPADALIDLAAVAAVTPGTPRRIDVSDTATPHPLPDAPSQSGPVVQPEQDAGPAPGRRGGLSDLLRR